MGGTVTVVTHAELSTETMSVALGLPVDTITGKEVVISVGKKKHQYCQYFCISASLDWS